MRYSDCRGIVGRYVACVVFLSFLFFMGFSAAAEPVKFEYRIVPLGSLTALQKDKGGGKTQGLEALLNVQGQEGWEMVNIFAVRTTFDPNVFFAVMKRSLPSGEGK